jgi:multiple sugar transport system permease protein
VVIVSLLLAVLLNRKMRGVGFFRTVYFLPTVTSAVATALVWNMIYGKETGILNFALETLGVAPVCWLCTDNAMMSVVIVNIWGAIGEGMIIFLAGLTAIPRDYYEAASLDGANDFQQFVRVTLPLVTPSIFFQTLITTINAFQAYDYIYMLTRRGRATAAFPWRCTRSIATPFISFAWVTPAHKPSSLPCWWRFLWRSCFGGNAVTWCTNRSQLCPGQFIKTPSMLSPTPS